MLQLLEGRIATQIIWNYARPFIYLFSHSFTSAWAHGDFIDWVIIQCYFVAQIVPDLTIGSSFSWLLCLFDIPHVCVCVYEGERQRDGGWETSVLELQDTLSTSCIISCPVLEPAVYPRSPGYFYWRTVLETKIWALGVFEPEFWTQSHQLFLNETRVREPLLSVLTPVAQVSAYLRGTAGPVPDHHNKANHRSFVCFFPSAHKLCLHYTIVY